VAGGSHTAAPISPVSNQVENSKIGEGQEVRSERCRTRVCTKYIVERKPIPVRAIVEKSVIKLCRWMGPIRIKREI